MKGFDVLKVKSAVKSKSRMSLRQGHLTTADFGQILPLYHRSLLPGDEFNVPARYFCRMSPLVKPCYGRVSFKTASFFVPYHQVAFDAEAFMSGKTMYQGVVPDIRYFQCVHVMNLFINQYSTNVTNITSADFTYTDATGVLKYRKFTSQGKYIYKIYTMLGYSFPTNYSQQTSSASYIYYSTVKYNALPLLSFAKAYNDYMSQSQRFNTSVLSQLLVSIQMNKDVSNSYVSNSHLIYTNGLKTIFESILLSYENDYFTSAWQTPNNPISNVQDINTIDSPGTGDQIFNTAANTWLSQDTNDEINQRSLNLLRAFDNFVRRHNYAGSRDVQQVYAQFGVKVEDYRLKYAHIITTSEVPVQIGDVMNNAASTYAELGDYAGKGIMASENVTKYVSSDYGMLFIFGWFTVAPMMSFGFERETLKTSPLDFYNPEFDGVTVDAISYGEVFANPLTDGQDVILDNAVFGFTEKYNDYRYSRDQITGEFRDYHANSPMSAWHCGRYLEELRKNAAMVAQSSSMNTLKPYDSEYDRIFGSVNTGFDNFYLTCDFDVTAVRPMLSLNQAPDLGEGNVVVPRNGNTLN